MPRPTPTERPPTADIMRGVGLQPDPWQIEVLQSTHPQLLLNCCRQAGKTTVVAFLALIEAMCKAMTRVVLVSRSHRQSREVLRLMNFYYDLLGAKSKLKVNADVMAFANMSRIVCLRLCRLRRRVVADRRALCVAEAAELSCREVAATCDVVCRPVGGE